MIAFGRARPLLNVSKELVPKLSLINKTWEQRNCHELVIATNKTTNKDQDCPTPQQVDKTSSLNSNFCLELANHMLQKNADTKKGSNTVISPLSFHVLLSLIAVGSKGKTLEQLLKCLGSRTIDDATSLSSQIISLASDDSPPNGSKDDLDLSFVNGAWVSKDFKLKPSFQEIVEGVYHAKAKEVDFENEAAEFVAEVNAWVEKATKGLIQRLLTVEDIRSGPGEKAALVLANALYFKGKWAQRFDSSRTEHRVFHLLNGGEVRVPFMTSFNRRQYFAYGSFDGYKVLKLPYKTSDETTRKLAMYIFLPKAINGLNNLLERFRSNPNMFTRGFNHHLRTQQVSPLWIPKWKFSFEFEASETMKQLGLDLPFDTRKAEITEMVDSSDQSLYVKKMVHKAFVEVDEEGTKAAACTAAAFSFRLLSSGPPPPIPSFVADHPFMFMIKEEISGVVFFVGSVLNPKLES